MVCPKSTKKENKSKKSGWFHPQSTKAKTQKKKSLKDQKNYVSRKKVVGPTLKAQKQKHKKQNHQKTWKITNQEKKVVGPTPKALAATVKRDPKASHSLKLEKAAFR